MKRARFLIAGFSYYRDPGCSHVPEHLGLSIDFRVLMGAKVREANWTSVESKHHGVDL